MVKLAKKLTKQEGKMIRDYIQSNVYFVLKAFVEELKIKSYKAKDMQQNNSAVSVHVMEDILEQYQPNKKQSKNRRN